MALFQIKTIRIRTMKALELLYQYQQADELFGGYMSKHLEEAIEVNDKDKALELTDSTFGPTYEHLSSTGQSYPL